MDPFYESTPESILRFGDVIKGFHAATPRIDDPAGKSRNDWTVRISSPEYLAVMTPCCSIERRLIVVAPLREIRPAFLNNDFFAEDLTRINQKVAPENSVPRNAWEQKLPPSQKEELLAGGPKYTFVDCFVYGPHDLLLKYEVTPRKGKDGPLIMGHYMVDFKAIYGVDCDKINRNGPAPRGIKLLQLKVDVRHNLRAKLSFYFGREPAEDQL